MTVSVETCSTAGRVDGEAASSTEFARAVSVYRAIQNALGVDEDAHEQAGGLEVPLGDILDLLPRHYRASNSDPSIPRDKLVSVPIDDLFVQLARGRVAVTIARLLFAVPPSLIAPDAFKDQTNIELPLPLIVNLLDPQVLLHRTGGVSKTYDTEGLPDLFAVASGVRIAPLPDQHGREAPHPSKRPARMAPGAFQPGLTESQSEQEADSPAVPPLAASFRPGLRAAGRLPKPLLVEIPAPDPADSAATPLAAVAPEDHAASGTSAKPAPEAGQSPAEEAILAFQSIQLALGEASTPDEQAVRVELPSAEAAALLPEEYRNGLPPLTGAEPKTVVVIDNLFDQLAQGRVAIPTAQLALGMPASLVPPEALLDQRPLSLPLSLVVAAVGPSALESRAAAKGHPYDISRLPDFFVLGSDGPAPAAPPAHARPVVPAAPAAPAPAQPVAEDFGDVERLAGVNLNTATEDQLMTLDGVAAAVARRIVDYRREHGPFKDVFALADVPRIGRKTFRAITGMPFSRKQRHRRDKLAALLRIPAAKASHLPTLAQALATRHGFSACVISDRQGFLLAAHGADAFAEALSAVLPTLIREIGERMRECAPDAIEATSLHMAGRLLTIAPSGDVFLTALHQAGRLTIGELRLITRVAKELAWLLGRRGYVATE